MLFKIIKEGTEYHGNVYHGKVVMRDGIQHVKCRLNEDTFTSFPMSEIDIGHYEDQLTEEMFIELGAIVGDKVIVTGTIDKHLTPFSDGNIHTITDVSPYGNVTFNGDPNTAALRPTVIVKETSEGYIPVDMDCLDEGFSCYLRNDEMKMERVTISKVYWSTAELTDGSRHPIKDFFFDPAIPQDKVPARGETWKNLKKGDYYRVLSRLRSATNGREGLFDILYCYPDDWDHPENWFNRIEEEFLLKFEFKGGAA